MSFRKILSILLLAVMLLLCCSCTESKRKAAAEENTENAQTSSTDLDVAQKIEQLAGTATGVLTGTLYDKIAAEHLPDCPVKYFNSSADLAVALQAQKVSSFITDEPIALAIIDNYPSQYILTTLEPCEYAYAFPMNKPGSEKLRSQMNAYIAKCRENGTIDEFADIWFGSDTSRQTVDRSTLTGENGTVTLSICSAGGKPFTYLQDKEYVGYDIDLAARFCAEYGYYLEIVDYDPSGLFSSISGGKCDIGACGIVVTPERSENMLFSDPNYIGGCVLVVTDGEAEIEDTGFFESIKESFVKTFIREDRYLLFLSGIGTTLLIVLLALIFGSVLGFVIYLFYYRAHRPFKFIVDVMMKITENTPVVVILMILYYIVFGSIDVSSVLVSVIGFTLIFAGSVIGLLKVGVGAVDGGQKEAALALGYTENQSFMRIVLPQAAKHFLPGYKSAIVQLIKGTAIVGYIAVQDLTKVSDIIRSRTYEAFFPLIATAVIYFAMALIMSAIVKHIEINIDPASRRKLRILKGVKLK